VSKALATSRKKAPVSRLSSKFLLTFSTFGPATASCCVLVETQTARHAATRARLVPGGPKGGGSSRRACQQCQVDLWIYRKKVAWGHFPLQYGYHANVFPCWWEILPAENCVKHFVEEGYHALR
jgi:hypothetical protein